MIFPQIAVLTGRRPAPFFTKSAKELYRNYTEEHSKIKIDRNTNFTKDIADSFFEKRMRNHSARNKNTRSSTKTYSRFTWHDGR